MDECSVRHDQREGQILRPLPREARAAWKPLAVGRLGSGNTVRTDRYRYREFRDKKGIFLGRMLYDHHRDPRENVNVAERPENQRSF